MESEVPWSAEAVTLAITAVSAWLLYRRWKRDVLVSTVGGLHLNAFVCCGIGGFCFVTFGSSTDRIPYDLSMDYFPRVGLAFLLGYLFWVPVELRLASRAATTKNRQPVGHHFGSTPLLCLLLLSFVGYFGSQSDLALSGVGTVFPVLKGFLYPSVVLAIMQASSKDAASVVLATLVLVLATYLAVLSPWRSELIMLTACLGLAWGLKFRGALPAIGALLLVGILLLLPFADYKKNNYEEFQRDPTGAFIQSFGMDLDERVTFTGRFLGVRVDALREMVYVENALDRRWTEYRYGNTYWEVVQQLVPRLLWPNKPSFNQTTNFLLPRQIGLLAWDDPHTSWGVSLYAEFIWNLPYVNLVWFVPLAFAVAQALDVGVDRFFVKAGARWFVKLNLFFLAFQIVGLVGAVTYVLWTFIAVKVVGYLAGGGIEQNSAAALSEPRLGESNWGRPARGECEPGIR